MLKFVRLSFGWALALSLMILPSSAQVICSTTVGVTALLRSDGLTEPVADYFLDCTGGTPTAAGSLVPQVNLTIVLNTVATEKITAANATGTYTETLALVDEPNTPPYPNGRPVLNCGQTGAPDSGGLGPAACDILSTGDPTATYDGTQNSYGAINVCDGLGGRPPADSYKCGRPNAFQGKFLPGGETNEIVFVIPFDPPGPIGHRYIRITNLRANAFLLGLATPPAVTQVLATVSFSGAIPIIVPSPILTVGVVQPGMVLGGCGTPAASTVRLCEGFAPAWKARNLSFFVGDNVTTAGNATYTGPFYTYSGTTNDPLDVAQNVPGVFFETESMFQWQNNPLPNGPPSTNPPQGFGSGTVPNLGYPLGSVGYGGTNTNPEVDGVATSGTRVALRFSGVPGGASIAVPLTANLFRSGCSPCTATGVLALTNADAAGGGPFNAATSTTVGASGVAVYEVLYADPFSIQYADIPYTVTGGSSAGIVASPTFAPFYTDAASAQPSQTGFLPRFQPAGAAGISALIGTITGMGLPKGTTTSLIAKLNAAEGDIASGDVSDACGSLTALINEASAQSGKKLTVAQANTIISMATALRTQLGC